MIMPHRRTYTILIVVSVIIIDGVHKRTDGGVFDRNDIPDVFQCLGFCKDFAMREQEHVFLSETLFPRLTNDDISRKPIKAIGYNSEFIISGTI